MMRKRPTNINLTFSIFNTYTSHWWALQTFVEGGLCAHNIKTLLIKNRCYNKFPTFQQPKYHSKTKTKTTRKTINQYNNDQGLSKQIANCHKHVSFVGG